VSTPAFLEPDAVMFLHDQSIREYGGYHGVRDTALLESALQRPVNKYEYEAADTVTLAAAYAFGLAKNHAFLDGNKRTAWACCVLFLKLNGIEPKVPPAETVEAMVSLATGEWSETRFAAWLGQYCASHP